jgi:hypothetical protein
MFDRMMNTKKCPELSAINPLRAWVARELQVSIEECHYGYGERLRDGEEMLSRFAHADDSALERQKRQQAAAERWGMTRAVLAETTAEWTERISNWRTGQDTHLAEIQARHREDIKRFEAKWADPHYLLTFNKASPRLIFLRNNERNMALFRQFERAKKIKAEADRLEKEEAYEAQKRAIAAMKLDFQTMIEKQKRELTCLSIYIDSRVELYEKKRDESVHPIQMIIDRLSEMAHPAKVRERKKDWFTIDAQMPTPVRPVRTVESARSLRPMPGLGLGGIRVRQHIKVPKDPAKSGRKSKKETESF